MEQDPKRWKAQSGAFWSEAAANWSQRGLATPEATAELADQLQVQPNDLLLDAGCGVGRWSLALAQQGYRVVGIDLAEGMIAHARAMAASLGLSDLARFEQGDVEQLPVAPALFDAALCFNVMDFVPAPATALGSLWAALKPGGRLQLMVLGAYSPVKHDLWRRFLPGDWGIPATNFIMPWEMEALVQELGWQILAQQPLFGPSASGQPNSYDRQAADRLADRVLQQTIASAWSFTLLKPLDAQT